LATAPDTGILVAAMLTDPAGQSPSTASSSLPAVSDAREAVPGSPYAPSGRLGQGWLVLVLSILVGGKFGSFFADPRDDSSIIAAVLLLFLAIVATVALGWVGCVRNPRFMGWVGASMAVAYWMVWLHGTYVWRPSQEADGAPWFLWALSSVWHGIRGVGPLRGSIPGAPIVPILLMAGSIVGSMFLVRRMLGSFTNGYCYDEFGGRWARLSLWFRTAAFVRDEAGTSGLEALRMCRPLEAEEAGSGLSSRIAAFFNKGNPDSAPSCGKWGEVCVSRLGTARGEAPDPGELVIVMLFNCGPDSEGGTSSSLEWTFFASALEVAEIRRRIAADRLSVDSR
jgi:hypothetical protein